MGSLSARAEIARLLALAELEQGSPILDLLAEHDDAVDADGHQVMLVFAPDEPARQMVADVLRSPHPVLVATETGGAPVVVRAAQPAAPWDGVAVPVTDLTVAGAVGQLDIYRGGVVLVCSLSGGRVLVTDCPQPSCWKIGTPRWR